MRIIAEFDGDGEDVVVVTISGRLGHRPSSWVGAITGEVSRPELPIGT